MGRFRPTINNDFIDLIASERRECSVLGWGKCVASVGNYIEQTICVVSRLNNCLSFHTTKKKPPASASAKPRNSPVVAIRFNAGSDSVEDVVPPTTAPIPIGGSTTATGAAAAAGSESLSSSPLHGNVSAICNLSWFH